MDTIAIIFIFLCATFWIWMPLLLIGLFYLSVRADIVEEEEIRNGRN